MQEIWKDIKGYEGYYQISSFGRVRSLDRFDGFKNNIKGKLIKCFLSKTGYVRVSLSKNQKYKKFQVHRLVAQAFIENKNNFSQVNHIDEKRDNNNVNNLEWCSAKYNSNYGNRPKRISKIKSKPVISISGSGLMRYFKSARKASEVLGVEFKNISAVANGKRNHTGGYRFMFYELKEVK